MADETAQVAVENGGGSAPPGALTPQETGAPAVGGTVELRHKLYAPNGRQLHPDTGEPLLTEAELRDEDDTFDIARDLDKVHGLPALERKKSRLHNRYASHQREKAPRGYFKRADHRAEGKQFGRDWAEAESAYYGAYSEVSNQIREDFPGELIEHYAPNARPHADYDNIFVREQAYRNRAARLEELTLGLASMPEHVVQGLREQFPGMELTPKTLLRLEEDALSYTEDATELEYAARPAAADFKINPRGVERLLKKATPEQRDAWQGLQAEAANIARAEREFVKDLMLEIEAEPLRAKAALIQGLLEKVTGSGNQSTETVPEAPATVVER